MAPQSEEQNYYRPPQADLVSGLRTPGEGGITASMVETLRKTRPWVLFISILGLVATGLFVVIGVVAAVALLFSPDAPETALIGVFYLVAALIYFAPFYLLFKYAGAIKGVVQGGGAGALEGALERQYAFWRLIGILSLVVLGIYAVILVFAVIFGVIAAASGG